ncbi:MAG TPA: efflux RND transporter periplasmic adaptor subunit [Bryobacteraceae bacterium]|nr:efflux RND transporter periplasmic adaptor subunit [Bryobacteraceae bacterium]
MKKSVPVILVGLLIGAFAACGLFPKRRDDRNPGTLAGTVETREIQVGSKVGGRVAEVLVEEGQNVAAGSVLVRFESFDLRAEQAQWQARVAQAEAQLKRLQAGYRPEEVMQAEANARREAASVAALKEGARPQEVAQAAAEYNAALADATNAETTFQRMDALFNGGNVSAQVRDDARARRDQMKGHAEAAKQRLDLLRAGTRPEDVKAGVERLHQAQASAQMTRKGYRPEEVAEGRARLAEATAQLQQIAVKLSESEVKVPANSRVEVVSVRPGDLVTPGRPVVTLLEPSQLWVRVFVAEPDLGKVAVGQKAIVRIDTFPDREFSGTVDQISSQGEFLPRNVQTRDDRNHQVFGVKIRIDNSSGTLKSGMAATVKLEGRS